MPGGRPKKTIQDYENEIKDVVKEYCDKFSVCRVDAPTAMQNDYNKYRKESRGANKARKNNDESTAATHTKAMKSFEFGYDCQNSINALNKRIKKLRQQQRSTAHRRPFSEISENTLNTGRADRQQSDCAVSSNSSCVTNTAPCRRRQNRRSVPQDHHTSGTREEVARNNYWDANPEVEVFAKTFLFIYHEIYKDVFEEWIGKEDERSKSCMINLKEDASYVHMKFRDSQNLFAFRPSMQLIVDNDIIIEELKDGSPTHKYLMGESFYIMYYFHIISILFKKTELPVPMISLETIYDFIIVNLLDYVGDMCTAEVFLYRKYGTSIEIKKGPKFEEDKKDKKYNYLQFCCKDYLLEALSRSENDFVSFDTVTNLIRNDLSRKLSNAMVFYQSIQLIGISNGQYCPLPSFNLDYDSWFMSDYQRSNEYRRDVCQNCMRKQFTDSGRMKLTFHFAHFKQMQGTRSPFKQVAEGTEYGSKSECNLCSECYMFLVKKKKEPKYMYPSFMSKILFGSHKPKFGDEYSFYSVYTPGTLWRFIPKSFRKYWIEAIRNVKDEGRYIYENCSMCTPPPIFDDKTEVYNKFQRDEAGCLMGDCVDAMNNIEVTHDRCECPWGCGTAVCEAGRIPFDLIVQRCLLKITLPFYSDWKKYRFVHYSSNMFFREDGEYEDSLMNGDWGIRPSVLLDINGLHVCSCREHGNGGRDKLFLFMPRSPTNHKLNSKMSDQLANIVKVPKIAKPTKAKKYNTTFSMVQHNTKFMGSDTFSVTTHSYFNNSSYLLHLHECASVVGRADAPFVINQKVRNNQLSQEAADGMIEVGKKRYTLDFLLEKGQGATYVGFEDSCRIQLYESSENAKCIKVIKDRNVSGGVENEVVIDTRRSWPILINILQTEDKFDYGTQFRSIPKFSYIRGSTSSALTYVMFSVLSTCKELWHIVDTKTLPFRENSWEGWLLTGISSMCFQYDNISIDQISPFKRLTIGKLMKKINSFVPDTIYAPECHDENDPSLFFKFNIKNLEYFFSGEEYDSICIIPSLDPQFIDDFTENNNSNNNNTDGNKTTHHVIIYTGRASPTHTTLSMNGKTYELRSVTIITSTQKACVNKFDSIRYMRHGKGFTSWWKQEKQDPICTKTGNNLLSEFQTIDDSNPLFLQYTCVFVIIDHDPCIDYWKMELFKCMGGKTHVRCKCCDFPVISTYKRKEKKLKCNCCLVETGLDHSELVQLNDNCSKVEKYICSNPKCCLRMCKTCYDSLPNDKVTMVQPKRSLNHQNNEQVISNNHLEEVFGDENDFVDDDSYGNNSLSSFDNCLNDDNDLSQEDFITSSPLDYSLDITEDNTNNNEGFTTTNSGESACNIKECGSSNEIISGHVVFNQIGSCTKRTSTKIHGTSMQNHFIHSLCATAKGQPCPLISVEGSMFWRHSYLSASKDKYISLGALPTFFLSPSQYPYGFDSTTSHCRYHMRNCNSTTYSDFSHMGFYMGIQSNKALTDNHSRDITERGFVVDNKTASGFSVRDKGSSKLAGFSDSVKMARGLGASSQFLDHTVFLTLTGNQALFPGLKQLHEWKSSGLWREKIDGYYDLTPQHQSEINMAFEEAYGAKIFRVWHIVKHILLKHIKKNVTCFGSTCAIFARDEYQKSSGNLNHNHLILAVKKNSMSEETKEYIQNLVRTSVMEIIKEEDLPRLMEHRIINSWEDYNQCFEVGGKVLPHICDDRCWIRVGEGDYDLQCRKLHSVFASPDPTKHSYIHYKNKFSPDMKETLESIGLYTPPDPDSNDPLDDGTYNHPFFNQVRHIAPCNYNARCNMSPIVPDIFCAFQSSINVQIMINTNGVSKYICKYITKFDKGNEVVLSTDAHTGEYVLSKHHLHNTKVVTSNINENKRMNKIVRNKNLARGRDMAYFEMRQLLYGDAEVFTNIKPRELLTLSFEHRTKNSVKLSDLNRNTEEARNNPYHDPNRPSDNFSRHVLSYNLRFEANFPEFRQMTQNQILTHRNHEGRSGQYCDISQFSLRPPELLYVFNTPVEYFRYCFIEPTVIKEKEIDDVMSLDLMRCHWIDGLSRRVKLINIDLNNELTTLLKNNITRLSEKESRNDRENLGIEMNKKILSMIERKNKSKETQTVEEMIWNKVYGPIFFHDSSDDLLPIPYCSNVTPVNAHQFFMHIILSLGSFITEIDAFTVGSSREAFRNANLIGMLNDMDSLKQYSRDLLRKYIVDQLVYLPISMNKAQFFILFAKKFFDEVIINDSLPMSELPPFTMSGIRTKQMDEKESYLAEERKAQLLSIYKAMVNTEGIPDKEDVENVTRTTPLDWDPEELLRKYNEQSDESFEEQKFAIGAFKRQIDKYRSQNTFGVNRLVKSSCIYGAPGTGKSHVFQLANLYAISQGLNTVSTALMGKRAGSLGGNHLHNWLGINVNREGKTIAPFKMAEGAIEKIQNFRDKTRLYSILTMDVLFLDEFGMVSAELLSVIELILRKIRKSELPFGGVLLCTTMDHTQIQPIKQLPVLCSSFMLTCFQFVKLVHSVRAHNDPDFQELQQMTRMSPLVLLSDQRYKERFYFLMEKCLVFVKDWKDPRILPNMVRCFSRKVPAIQATKEYVACLKSTFQENGIPFIVSKSIDESRSYTSNADYQVTTNSAIEKHLSKSVKESSEVVFFKGGVYELTQNDSQGRYKYSQAAMMMDVPSAEDVEAKRSIKVWVAPTHFNVHEDYDPEKEYTTTNLQQDGWVELSIGIAPTNIINCWNGTQAKRTQYALRHCFSVTINSTQGGTFFCGVAFECTRQYSPWQKGQGVVILSRTTIGSRTIVVGEEDYAKKRLWEIIIQQTQWDQFMEQVLHTTTINKDESDASLVSNNTLDITKEFPYNLSNYQLPTENGGYVYFIISLPYPENIYIGQTTNLSQRLNQHNNGVGSLGTHNPKYHPWALGAFICGLDSMYKNEREAMESRWKHLVNSKKNEGCNDIYQWILCGQQIVIDYNNNQNNREKISFVLCVEEDPFQRRLSNNNNI